MLGCAKHDTAKYMKMFIAHRDYQCDKSFPGHLGIGLPSTLVITIDPHYEMGMFTWLYEASCYDKGHLKGSLYTDQKEMVL